MEGVAGERDDAPVVALVEAGETATADNEGFLGLSLPEIVVGAAVFASDTASVVRAVTGVLMFLAALEAVLPGSLLAASLPIAGASAFDAGDGTVDLLVVFLSAAAMLLSALLAFASGLGLFGTSAPTSGLPASRCLRTPDAASSAFAAPVYLSTAFDVLTGRALASSSTEGGFFLLSEI